MKDFREIKAWQKAHALVLFCYKLTSKFPKEEKFGLTSQIRRAAVSVSTNIVEGNSRNSDTEFRRFINISESSAAELEYLFLLCYDLNLITPDENRFGSESSIEIRKMLAGLKKKLNTHMDDHSSILIYRKQDA